MPRKVQNTKGHIVSAAWELFYEQGYDNTTVEDILAKSGTSKGTFYHYFEGKDALLSTLSVVFDEKYEELLPQIPPEQNALETLAFLNQQLFSMIDARIPLDLLARLLSTQLTTRGEIETQVLSTPDRWFGVTYQEDKPGVMAALQKLHQDGVYPETLWK